MGIRPGPVSESAREHLRNALQALMLEAEEGRLLTVSQCLMATEAAQRRIQAALGILDQVHVEAELHPFQFARHVAEVV